MSVCTFCGQPLETSVLEYHTRCLRQLWYAEARATQVTHATYQIQHEDQDSKSRLFKAVLLGKVSISEESRPVWACFTSTSAELRAFCANIRMGRKVVESRYGRTADKIEFLKTTNPSFAWQQLDTDASVVIYQADLFVLDPGMVDTNAGIRFICMPGFQWLQQQVIEDETRILQYALESGFIDLTPQRDGSPSDQLKEAAILIPLSHLVGAYLDRRTRVPILNDARFYFQLLLRLRRERIARFSERYSDQFKSQGMAQLGYCEPLQVFCSHTGFEGILAEETALFLRKTR